MYLKYIAFVTVGAIEFHGEQHFNKNSSGRFSQTEEKFLTGQKYDKIKKDYLQKAYVPLLIIPYSKIGNIKEMIEDFIIEINL